MCVRSQDVNVYKKWIHLLGYVSCFMHKIEQLRNYDVC